MKRVLCFGDSNTWGLIPGTTNRYPENVRWTGLLSKYLGSDYTVIEEGLCGRTSQFEDKTRIGRNSASTLPFILESHYPVDLVVLMVGTNDLKSFYGRNGEQIASGVANLISIIKKVSPATEILVVSPIELGSGVGEYGFDPEFDEVSVKVSKTLPEFYGRISYKYGVKFLKASDYVSPSSVDREHLDEDGHRVFAGVVFEAISKIYSKDKPICG